MSHRVLLATASAVLTVALVAVSAPASADAVSEDAVDWLATQQEADGGFEVADFPPFEGPDAILAIAANAQTTSTWSTSEAFAAVQALDKVPGSNNGGTPLEWAEAFLSGPTPPTAAIAAKFLALVVFPLGLNPFEFNSDQDADSVDLMAILEEGRSADGSFGAFNGTLFGALAQALQENPNVRQDTLQVICEAQHADGGFDFTGSPTNTDIDPDSTGLALQALIAAGVPAADPAPDAAADMLETNQEESGAWMNPFGSEDPNSTSMAMLGLDAAGRPTPVAEGDAWLITQQLESPPADNGRFTSPNDIFPPVNTFATSQAVQGHLRNWLPVDAADHRRCLPEAGYTDVLPWFENAARWFDFHDIASGFPDNTFRGSSTVNRGQAAAWIWNTMDHPGGNPPHGFNDVPNSAFYAEAVRWAFEETVVTGFPDDTYRPKNPVNRGQIVNMIWAASGRPNAGEPDHGFTDVPDGAFYDQALRWAVAKGIVSGFQDNTFRPKDPVTRGQLANMLWRHAINRDSWLADSEPSTAEFTPYPF